MKARNLYWLFPIGMAVGVYWLTSPSAYERPADPEWSVAPPSPRTAAPLPPATPPAVPLPTVYWTDPGVEPDTCVAAWLLTRFVTPGARVEIGPQPPPTAIPFDVAGCELQRQPGQATSDLVRRHYGLTDPFAERVVAVVREIELMPWTTNEDTFFVIVRAGLAEAVNASPSDVECLQRALAFLDDLRRPDQGGASTTTEHAENAEVPGDREESRIEN